MKKLFTAVAIMALVAPALAQDDKKEEFDSKFRFGLRITPQPTWFVSGNKKNDAPAGAVFGFGFGLNLEYWFSNKVCLLTGIGGDFEGGKVAFRHDADYKATYWLDESDAFVENPSNDKKTSKHVMYEVNERKIKTTHLTIPIILKLTTQEYSGIKYFGMFGGELGYRVNAKAYDTYYQSQRTNDTGAVLISTSPEPGSDLNINPQTWFARVCFNAGLGLEYRLAGSTSAFVSLNYFRSMTNLMKTNEKYMYYAIENGNKYIKSRLFMTGVRINIGIMF
jgi:hypothetical protein